MKKIIEVGRKEPIYYDKCNNCSTKYTYQKEDVYDGINEHKKVDCPHCGQSNHVIFFPALEKDIRKAK